MEESEIYSKLTTIFSDVFDDDIELTPQTTAADVEGWDSMSHIRLVLTIERQFNKRFPAARVSQLKDVADLVSLIQTTP